MNSPWHHLHVHSRYSNQDALASVPDLVTKAKKMNQPAISLTDHGLMSGTIELYKECKAHDILPWLGFEGYLLDPDTEQVGDDEGWGIKVPRFHFGLLARNLAGYTALVRFLSQCHTKPRVIGQGAKVFPRNTYADLQALGEVHGDDLILTTGCFFGLLQQTLITKGEKAARQVVRGYQQYFPHTVVELQHHNIGEQAPGWHDNSIVDVLIDIANQTGAMVIATQDSHYLDQANKPAHTLMKKMLYEQDEFPGETFHLSTTEFIQEHYQPKVWDQIEETAQVLLDLHELEIPPLDTYKVRIPKMPTRRIPVPGANKKWYMTSDAYLRELVLDAFSQHVERGTWQSTDSKKYVTRIEEELSVIKDMKLADYFLLVLLVVQYCHEHKICVECRGSGNSSLVGFVLGITQVDPIRWGLFFSRFLSRDRVKPPDFDLDVETERRQELVDYLSTVVEVMRIGTFGILGSSPAEPERGNALVTYLQYLRKTCQQDAAKQIDVKYKAAELAKQLFQQRYSHIQGLSDVKTVSPSDYKALRQLIETKPYRSYGVHAAGVLIGTEDVTLSDYIPQMMVVSSKAQVTQYTMDDLALFGLVKLDILGQDSLSVMKQCCELIGRPDPNEFSWIPEDDKETMEVMREGRPDNGVYHF
jgi:DNA polymerase III subunit alpha